ncbi:phosphotransferase [Streptomyces sp. 2321.6]|uniref:phosphotransferase n=1 Tax=Streptomyces sp. 2321.6 TaxID=1938840 RepID=UPI00211B7674|nr:phosphotransferase [Streptomyces sp. 2321.6]
MRPGCPARTPAPTPSGPSRRSRSCWPWPAAPGRAPASTNSPNTACWSAGPCWRSWRTTVRPPARSRRPGWVHGDFHPLNVLYRDAEPTAIVDWDRLGVHPRAEEAVRAAAIFFVRPCGTLDLAKVAAYAGAYRRTCHAGADELAAAVHRVWWERLNDFWMLTWRYQLGDRRTDPQFPAAAALAVWWTREYRAVRNAFTG